MLPVGEKLFKVQSTTGQDGVAENERDEQCSKRFPILDGPSASRPVSGA